jgi:hypothetical protein
MNDRDEASVLRARGLRKDTRRPAAHSIRPAPYA